MTGTAFLDALMALADKNTSDTSYRAMLLTWINLVIKDIQNRQQGFHWQFLEKTATTSTVASQFYYGLPSDIDTTKTIKVYEQTNDISYKFVPYDRFRKYVSTPTDDTGTARLWTLWGSQIGLYPVPDSAITIYLDYVQLITALTDAASSCEIPAKFDPVVIDGVLAYIYRFDPELGQFATQMQAYEAGIERMISDNQQYVAEEVLPESHRTRFNGSLEAFPLDPTNM